MRCIPAKQAAAVHRGFGVSVGAVMIGLPSFGVGVVVIGLPD